MEGSKDAEAEVPADDAWGISATASGADDGWGVPSTETPAEAAKDEAPAEVKRREDEEDKTLTLDQYLAQQKEKVSVPKLENVRQANDGDDDIFKNAIPVNKEEDEDVYFAAKVRIERYLYLMVC